MNEFKVGDYVVHDGGKTIYKVVGFSKGWVNCNRYINTDYRSAISFRNKELTKVEIEDIINEDIKDKLIRVSKDISYGLGSHIKKLKEIKKVSSNHNDIYIDTINKLIGSSEKLHVEINNIIEKELSDEV